MGVVRAFVGKGYRYLVRAAKRVGYGVDNLLFSRRMSVTCPCCGLRFRGFVPGPFASRPERYDAARYAHVRQDVICPYCGSLPRHRILATWCEGRVARLRASRILYFAPESSMMLWMRRCGVRCTTADLVAKADLRLDIQATGLADESFDVVIANHVLEHVEDYNAALAEVRRILRPSGAFICSFPMDPAVELLEEDPGVRTEEERRDRYGQVDHVRLFGAGAGRLLEEVGFAVEAIEGTACPEEIVPVVGPADYDINLLFCCRKEPCV